MDRAFFAILLTITLAVAACVAVPAQAAVMLTVPATANTPPIPVYVARPLEGGPFPAVLLLHGCGGFDGLLAVAADRLVPHGYVGIALDALGPHNMQTACNGNDDGDEAAAARATLAWLRTQPYVASDRLAIVGFSMGADAALALIDSHGTPPPNGLRAVAAFYPWCQGRDGLVTVPLAIFDGDADTIAPSGPCADMAHAAAAAGKPVTITTYPGATHGFDVPGPDRTFQGQTVRFDPAAAADAAMQTLRFLVAHLTP